MKELGNINEAIEVLKNHTQHFIPTEDIHALNMAIKSLEAWDKVKEDIKHSQFIFLDGDKEIECIPMFEVMNIVNKYLKEIEK